MNFGLPPRKRRHVQRLISGFLALIMTVWVMLPAAAAKAAPAPAPAPSWQAAYPEAFRATSTLLASTQEKAPVSNESELIADGTEAPAPEAPAPEAPVPEAPAPKAPAPEAPAPEAPAPEAPAPQAPAPEAPKPETYPINPDLQLIVRYRPGGAQVSSLGLLPLRETAGSTQLVQLAPDADLKATMEQLRRDPAVAYVEPNYVLRSAGFESNDPSFGAQWYLDEINAQGAWDAIDALPDTRQTVTVAVIDTGVDAGHEDLTGRILSGYNALTHTEGPGETADDARDGHGTHVAGIIAATGGNGTGIVGVAGLLPVQILPVKALDSAGYGTILSVADGIYWAVDHGARVINLSLGARLPDFPQTLADAVRYALERGVVVVAAAGNEGSYYMDGYYPASLPGVVAVSATDQSHKRAAFSNYADIGAPGVEILSTLPGNRYGTLSGTSAATPVVAGVAAALWSAMPQKTAAEISDAVHAEEPHSCQGYSCDLVFSARKAVQRLNGGGDLYDTIEFVEPHSDPARVSGTVRLTVHVGNPDNVESVEFYYHDPSLPADNSTLIGRVLGTLGGGNSDGPLLSLDWDTTALPDGPYELEAKLKGPGYDGQVTELENDWLDAVVDNVNEDGLVIDVKQPGLGTPAVNAPVQVYHLIHDGDITHAVIQERPDEFRTDAHGRVTIPGTLTTAGHDYLVVAQGGQPDFLLHQVVRAPAHVVLDGSNARPVTISAKAIDGTPLQLATVKAQILSPIPLKDRNGEPVLPQVAQTDATGSATVYLSQGHHVLVVMSADQTYYLKAEVTANDTTVALHPTPSTVAALTFAADGNYTSTDLGLTDTALGFTWGVPASAAVIYVTPGQYRGLADLTYKDPNPSVADTWLWKLKIPEFQAQPGPRILAFGGQLHVSNVRLDAEETPPFPRNASVLMSVDFTDSHGNRVSSLQLGYHSFSPRLEILDAEGNLLQNAGSAYAEWYGYASWFPADTLPVGTYYASAAVQAGAIATGANETSRSPAPLPIAITDGTTTPPEEPNSLKITVLGRDGAPLSGVGVSLSAKHDGLYEPVNWQYTGNDGVTAFWSGETAAEQALALAGWLPNEPDPFYLLVPVAPGVGEVTVDLSTVPLQTVTLLAQDELGRPLADRNVFWSIQMNDPSGAGLAFPVDDWWSGQMTVQLEQNKPYVFLAAQGEDFNGGGEYLAPAAAPDGPPARYLLNSGVITTASANESGLITLGGPDAAVLFTAPGAEAVTLLPTAAGATFGGRFEFYQWDGPLYISTGSYQALGILAQDTPDGAWYYYLAGDLTATPGSPATWAADLSLSLTLQLDHTTLGFGDTLHTAHEIRDSHGNRLLAVEPDPSRISAQNHNEVAPFLRILDGMGTEVYVFKAAPQSGYRGGFGLELLDDNTTTYFTGSYTLPAGALGGEYTAIVELKAGPGVDLSKTAAFTVQAAPPQPVLNALPSPTRAASVTVRGKTLAGLTVEVQYALGGTVEPVGTTTADAEGNFSVTAMLPGEGVYSFTARAIRNGTASNDSAPRTLTVDRTAPGQPGNLAAQAQDDRHVKLTWTAPAEADVTSYVIYRDGAEVATVLVGSSLQYMDVGLEALHTYRYGIKAVDAAGNQSAAAEATIETLAGSDQEPPTAVGNLAAVAAPGGKVTLTWTASEDNIKVAGYKVLRRTGSGDDTEVASLAAEELKYVDSGLPASTTYRYTVVAFDEAGNTSGTDQLPNPSAEATTPDLAIQAVTWKPALTRFNVLKQGGDLQVTLRSEPGRQASATVAIDTWLDEQGAKLPQVRQANLNLALTEVEAIPGTYRGTVRLPDGAAQVRSVEATVTDGFGHTVSGQLGGLPLAVAGELKITIPLIDGVTPEQLDSVLSGGRLVATSDSSGSGGTMPVTGHGDYRMGNLSPASDYSLRLYGPQGKELARLDGATALGGTTTDAVMPTPSNLPASLLISVVDPLSQPLPGVSVTVYDLTAGRLVATRNSADSLLFHNLTAGHELQLRLAKGLPFKDATQTLTLVPGANPVTAVMTKYAAGTVTGRVTGPDQAGIAGASVTVSQDFGAGKWLLNQAVTDQSGNYSVQVYGGPARVQVSSPYARYVAPEPLQVTVPDEGTVEANLAMRINPMATIDLRIYTQYAGQDQETGPIDLDWRVNVHFRVSARSQHGSSTSYSYPLTLTGSPGDKVTVCVDGGEGGLPKVCQDVTLDENASAVAEIHLKQGGRIDGSISGVFTPMQWFTYRLYEVLTENGTEKRTFVSNGSFAGGRFSTPVPKEGRYYMEVTGQAGTASITAAVPDNAIVDVGTLPLSSNGPFSGEGNSLSVEPAEAAPGGTVTMRAAYRNRLTAPADQAVMRLEIPADAELVAGSILHNGQPITGAPAADGFYELNLGTVPASGAGTITYKLKVKAQPQSASLYPVAHMRFGGAANRTDDVLGRVQVNVAMISLRMPTKLVQATTTASGRAPSGSTVEIYAGDLLIGQTQANIGGTWSARVTLPNTTYARWYEVTARSTHDDFGTFTTQPLRVKFDPNQPYLQTVTMRQQDGREVTFNPQEGVGIFPYVVVPYMPFMFKLRFNNPNLVQNVKVTMNGSQGNGVSATAVYNAEQNAFIATLSAAKFGPIYVTYDTKTSIGWWNPPVPDEELRRMMPPQLQNVEFHMVEPTLAGPLAAADAAESASIAFSVPNLPELDGRMNITVERGVAYQPNAIEQAGYAKTGIPVYGLSVTSFKTGERLTLRTVAFVPESAIPAKPGNLGAQNVGTVLRITKDLILEHGSTGLNVIDWGKNLYDGFGVPDKFKQLEGLLDTMDANCSANFNKAWQPYVQHLGDKVMEYEAIKWGLSLAGALLAPATFGLSLIAFGIGQALNYAMDAQIDGWINQMQQTIATSEDCKKKDDDPNDPRDPNRPPDPPDRDPDRDPSKDPTLDPVWIYDPSGYVYEGVTSNRVEGVKSTALEQQGDGSMAVWDATWYGQENPQFTDPQGKYGWDVPAGFWQVLWEKDGYTSATSPVMEVPPPRTEVNHGIVSLAAPAVTGVAVTADGAIQVAFSQYVKVSSLTGATLIVTDAAGDPVAGTVSAVAAEAAPDGTSLARKALFQPAAALTAGETYTVSISEVVLNYANRPMDADVVQTLTMPAAPAPAPVTGIQMTAGPNSLEVTWTDPAAIDFKQVELTWGTTTVTVARGAQSYIIAGVPGGVPVNVSLVAVYDSGARSAVATASAAPVDVTPPAAITNLQVTPGSDQLALTWQDPAAADLAKLKVTWTEPISGTTTVAEVNPGVRAYTITGLTADTQYSVSVAAVDASGNTSAVVSSLTKTTAPVTPPPGGGGGGGQTPPPADTTAPAEVSGLQVTPAIDQLTLTWTDPADADLAKVTLTWSATGEAGGSAEVAKGAQSYTITGLKGGVTYSLTLTTADAAGNVSAGVTAAGTPTKQAPPPVEEPPLPPIDGQVVLTAQVGTGSINEGTANVTLKGPAGTFAKATTLRISRLDRTKPVQPGLSFGSDIYLIDTLGVALQKRVQLTLRFSAGATDARKFGIYRLSDTEPNHWEYVGGVVHTQDGTVTAKVDRTGRYAVMAYDRVFTDLVNHWSRTDVEVLVSRYLVNGTTADQFQPDRTITRAELAKLLTIMLAQDPDRGITVGGAEQPTFSDVAPDAWYYTYVETAARLGLVKGSNGAFRPDDPVTREEMALMIIRALGLEDQVPTADPLQLQDLNQISGWAYKAVVLAIEHGLMRGTPGNLFEPRNNATRAEAAVVVLRALTQLLESGQ